MYLRPICRQDRAREAAIIAGFSDHSRYLRFFTGARTIPANVLDQLVDVDGYHHIAWGALDTGLPGWPLMGVVRAVRQGDTDSADLALGVLDAHHGKGIARLLLSAVVHDCLKAGISRLTAQTLSENAAARGLFRSVGGTAVAREGVVVSFEFDAAMVACRLAGIGAGRAMDDLRRSLAAGRLARSA